jgi:hypothetical protein
MSGPAGLARISTAHLLGFLLLASALSGCAVSPNIRTDAAPGVNLGQFRTFSFYTPLSTDRAGFHSLVSQQLMFSTRREMEVRGFEFVADPAEADVLINFHTHVTEQVRVRSVPDPWVGPSYWHHRRGFYDPWRGHSRWPSHNRLDVDQFSEGRLSVDLIDRRQNMLVWEGVASKRLTQRTLNDLGPAMDDAVHDMFRQFPLPPSL